jgi:uncharacterized protein
MPGAFVAAVHDPGPERAAIAAITPQLAEHRYLLLTTFKRDGTPVATPVWFAAEGGRLVVATQAGAWKVKRLRRNAHALGAGCDARGTPAGPTIELRGEVLGSAEHRAAERALERRYGVSAWGFRQAMRLAGRGQRDYLALRPA